MSDKSALVSVPDTVESGDRIPSAHDVLYPNRARAEAEFWTRTNFQGGFFGVGRPGSGDALDRATNKAYTGDEHKLWIDDLIDIDIRPTSSPGGIDDYTYRNIGHARTFGAQMDAACTLSGRLRAEAGYAYLWTRDDQNQRPLHFENSQVSGRRATTGVG